MKYFEFIDEMTKKIKLCFDKDVSVEVHKVLKNNSLEFDSLTILEPGCNVTPNFYLQPMYQKYVAGAGIDSLVAEIIKTYENGCKENVYENLSMEYKDCMDSIVMRLVSLKKNKNILKETPYIPFLDMAVIFYRLVNNDEGGIASIRITDKLMKQWKTDIKELYTLALSNSERIFEERIVPMSKMLQSFSVELKDIGFGDIEIDEGGLYEPYVITNTIGVNGAAVILYPDMLKKISLQMGGDFYILPSSIHEVLAISTEAKIKEAELKSMVKEVNETLLLPDEYLSDNVYRYNSVYNSLEMVG